MDRNQVLTTIIGPVVLLLIGVGLMIVPNYRTAAGYAAETALLQTRIDSMAALAAEVEERSSEHAQLRRHMAMNMKHIPDQPDGAAIMARLTLPVDGYSVLDNGFQVGQPFRAIEDDEVTSEKCLPMTFEMKANFESIFALIRHAESMDRLVRVARVRIGLPREKEKQADRSILDASVQLEAVFQGSEPVGEFSS